MLLLKEKTPTLTLSTRKNSFETNQQLLTNVQLFVRTVRVQALSPVNPGRPLPQQLERLL